MKMRNQKLSFLKKLSFFKVKKIENCFRSAKIERSGFLHPAEFSEICKKSLRSIFALRIYNNP